MADGHDSHGGGHGAKAGGGHGDSHGSSGGGKGGYLGFVKVLGIVLVVAFGVWALLSAVITPFKISGRSVAARDMQEVVEGQCNGLTQTLELGSEAIVFNPNALCTTNFSVEGGAIELIGPFGSITLKPGEKRCLPDMWFESARAVDGHAVLLYQLVQQT